MTQPSRGATPAANTAKIRRALTMLQNAMDEDPNSPNSIRAQVAQIAAHYHYGPRPLGLIPVVSRKEKPWP